MWSSMLMVLGTVERAPAQMGRWTATNGAMVVSIPEQGLQNGKTTAAKESSEDTNVECSRGILSWGMDAFSGLSQLCGLCYHIHQQVAGRWRLCGNVCRQSHLLHPAWAKPRRWPENVPKNLILWGKKAIPVNFRRFTFGSCNYVVTLPNVCLIKMWEHPQGFQRKQTLRFVLGIFND